MFNQIKWIYFEPKSPSRWNLTQNIQKGVKPLPLWDDGPRSIWRLFASTQSQHEVWLASQMAIQFSSCVCHGELFVQTFFTMAGWTSDGYKYSKVFSLSQCQRSPSVMEDIQHPLTTFPKLTYFLNHIIIILSWLGLQWISKPLGTKPEHILSVHQAITVAINWWVELYA